MLNGMPLSATGGAMGGAFFLPRANLQDLLDLLREDGRRLIGPTIADETIVYDEITSVDELPQGWGDEQGPGTYRLRVAGGGPVTSASDDVLAEVKPGETAVVRLTAPNP